MSAIQTRGESSAARFVDEQIADYNDSLQKSAALGAEHLLREELADVWEECRQPDWDAYHAVPVSTGSLNYARRILLAMPPGTRLPTVGAVPSGQITLEWHHSRRRSLTIIVSGDGDLHYAALLGPGRTSGTEPFFAEVPQVILDLIARVYQC